MTDSANLLVVIAGTITLGIIAYLLLWRRNSSARRPLDLVGVDLTLGGISTLATETVSQSRLSLWFSLGAASVGFAAILVTVFGSPTHVESWELWARLAASVVIEAVAALFFVNSTRAQTEMQSLYARLWRDHDIVKALTAATHIRDAARRDDAIESIVRHCITTKAVPSDGTGEA